MIQTRDTEQYEEKNYNTLLLNVALFPSMDNCLTP